MRSVIAALAVMMLVLSLSAAAMTDTSAFSTSFFKSIGTDYNALSTYSEMDLRTPDLRITGQGQITTEIGLLSGSSELLQNFRYSASKYYNYNGYASMSSSAAGTGVTGLSSKISFNGLTTLLNPSDLYDAHTNVQAKLFGLGMASIQTDHPEGCKTLFYNGGGHDTSVYAAFYPPIVDPDEKDGPPKGYTVSFEPYSLEFDQPADFVERDVSFDYMLSDHGVDLYNLNFYQELEVSGVSCVSEMTYLRRL